MSGRRRILFSSSKMLRRLESFFFFQMGTIIAERLPQSEGGREEPYWKGTGREERKKMTGWKTRLIHFHEGEGKGPFKGSLKARINHVPRALPSLDWYRRGWKRGHGTRVVAGVSKIMADVCRARQCRVHRWGNKKKGGNKTENGKKRAKLSISESFFAMLSRLSKRIVERGLNGDSLSRDLDTRSLREEDSRVVRNSSSLGIISLSKIEIGSFVEGERWRVGEGKFGKFSVPFLDSAATPSFATRE